jgi:hypothetical protein
MPDDVRVSEINFAIEALLTMAQVCCAWSRVVEVVGTRGYCGHNTD